MSLVRVKWIDAATHGGPGWVDLEDAMSFAEEPAPIMMTVGYFLHREEDPDTGYVVLTDTMGTDECASVHKIPNRMILSLDICPETNR